MYLFESIENYKNNIALVNQSTGSITYKQLIEKINIIKKIIPERSLVFLISQNTIAPLITYIASIKNNYVVILVDIKTNTEDITNLIKSYEPSFIVAPINWIKNYNQNKFKVLESVYDYYICKTNYKELPNMYNDLSVLLPTSGSMGSPKFVRLSKQNIKSNADSIIKYLKIDSNQRAITNMPYSYSYMLSIINTFIESGASIFVSKNSIIQKEFWTEFFENKITSLSGVPYIFEMFIKLGLKNLSTPYLKTITQAGGKLDRNLTEKIIEFCREQGIEFISMYGQTEASPRMTYLSWKDCSKKIGSIGKAIPFTEIWLEKDNGNKIENANETGELIFKGENVSMGYSNGISDLIKGNENKGILKTGDLAYFDSEGYFYIKGRKSRITKIFGNRLNLDEIEQKMKLNGVEVACKEISNKLFVFFNKNLLIEDVLKKLSHITGQNKKAFNCVQLKEMPRTSSGKINYIKLKVNAQL